MTEQKNTRTIRVRVVQRDGASGNLRDALTPPHVSVSQPSVAEQAAQEQAQK
ncbi:hypothetical protein [Streptomyces sp. NPDC001139]